MKIAALAQDAHAAVFHSSLSVGGSAPSAAQHLRLTLLLVVPIIVVAVAWLVASVPRWRQISWRDQMDTPVNFLPKEARRDGVWAAAWTVMVNQREVAFPSLVLLRVRNSGLAAIDKARVRRPMTFTFPGRDVVEYAVTDLRGITREEIQLHEMANASIIGNRIMLPRFPMRRGASYKLLVVLAGNERGVHGKGRLRGGRVVHETRGHGPLVKHAAFGTALALLLGVQAGLAFGQGPAIPSSCASGQLAMQGSSAFTPVAKMLGQAYTGVCLDAKITATATSSVSGLNALAATGSQKVPSDAIQIAMSDGHAPPGYPTLLGHPIGVIIFALVVNRQAGVFSLSLGQLRDIFGGKFTNWRQVGGPDLPIHVVARVSGSGTRRTFDATIYDSKPEPSVSSFDCEHKNAIPGAAMIRCEAPDTATLLARVNAIPGAIGYAQVADAASYANIATVKIDGFDPKIGAVESGAYPYWTVEYLYTFGRPPAGSLTSTFLDYMNSATARQILATEQYTPCTGTQPSIVAHLCSSTVG